jgi:short-subunit dehydrogenase
VGLILEKSSSDSKPVALVTGASSGIGAVYAEALAGAGYHLILVARREDKLKAVQSRTGGDILVADLATDAGVAEVAARIRDTPALDFLVNNAGFGTQGYFWEAPLSGQEAMHRLHVLAPMRLTHAALPRMVARNRGFIVNVSSVAGFGQNTGSVSYCATKTWMNSFTEGLWLELRARKSNVRVQALCPGYTRSEFHDVAELDMSRVPESLWHSAEDIVECSLNGLPSNELFVIPGWRYQTWVAMQKVLPREAIYAITKKSTDEFRKSKHA